MDGEIEHASDLLGRLGAGAEVGMKTRHQTQTRRQVGDPVKSVRQKCVIRVGDSSRANRAAANHEVCGAKLGGKLRGAANLVQLLPQNLRKDEVGAGVDPDELQLELFHQPAQLFFPLRVLDEVALEELKPGVARGGDIAHRFFSRPVREVEEIFHTRHTGRVAEDAAPRVCLIRQPHL